MEDGEMKTVVKMYVIVDFVGDEKVIKAAIEETPGTTVEVLERIHSKKRLLVTADLWPELQGTLVQIIQETPGVTNTEPYTVRE